MQKYSQYRYALRKLSVGLTSVAVGLAFMAATTTTVHADSEPQVQTTENQTSENKNEITVIENTNDNLAKVETINSQDKISISHSGEYVVTEVILEKLTWQTKMKKFLIKQK